METEIYLALVDDFSGHVYKAALSYCGNQSDAEDVVQNTFLKLLQRKEPFADEEHVKKWLIRVAINESKNMCTSFWRKRIVPLEESESISDTGFATEEQSGLYDAVMQLKEKYRVVIHLYYYEEYSIKEIAQILHIKETTVSTRLMRARAKLKEVLKEDWLDA